jgi:hypothetical protein
VEPAFDSPWEFVNDLPGVSDHLGDIPAWSSYAHSAAAFFHPDVMRAPPDGGWQAPFSFDDGVTVPRFTEAVFPSLKALMIEHHWNQNAPARPCNPAFMPGTFNDCEPWYFNHGLASEPATLFYDLSVRLFPNAEAIAADAQHQASAGYGLWSRDTPFGADGYFSEFSYDGTQTSHVILTTEGIRGRDTIAGAAATAIFGSARAGSTRARPDVRRLRDDRFLPGPGSLRVDTE